MAENLNTLYYALGLDDHEMQEGLKKAIQNLSVLDDEFNRINKSIEETFGKKIQNAPIHNAIKGLTARLKDLEKQWKDLEVAERRGEQGQKIRAEYEALRKEAGNLNNSLARLYSESQKAASGQKELAAQIGLVNKEFTLQSRALSNLKTLFTTYVSIFAAKSFIQSLAQVRGEFENQQIALRAILRDAEAADKLFSQIKSFAVVSPFEFKDFVGYAKQLSAFQVPVDELFETTKRLADVSAGLGVGMDRIILAYGQVRSAAVLRGQELRQFTEAGIPLVDELAKKFSELEGRVVSAGDVFEKISNRMVSFEMVKEIFEDMTNEGGMFYMMQEKQAESLKGKIANLADAYDIMLNDIGQANDGILKGGVEGIAALLSNWKKVWKILGSVIAAYGTYKTVLFSVHAIQKLVVNKEIITTMLQFAKGIRNAKDAMVTLNLAFKATPIGVIASLIAGLVGSLILFNDTAKTSDEIIQGLEDDINKLEAPIQNLNTLIDTYETLTSKVDRDRGEQDKLDATIKTLSRTVRDSASAFDEQGNALDVNIQKVKGYRDELIEISKRDAERSLEEANKQLEKLQKKRQELENRLNYGSDLQIASPLLYSPGGMQVGLTDNQKKKLQSDIGEVEKEYLKVTASIEKFNQRISDSNKRLSEDHGFSDWQKNLNDEISKLDISSNFKDQFSVRDFKDEFETLKDNVVQEYKKLDEELNRINKTSGIFDKAYLNDLKKRFSDISKLLKLYGGIDDKGGANSKDPNAERLKEQIDLIKKAQAQYEKYLQIMSPDAAVSKVKNEKQFERLLTPFDPNTVAQQLQSIYDTLSGSSGLQRLENELTEVGRIMNDTFGKGNVDLLTRPIIDAAKLTAKGWEDAGEGIATVFSSAIGVEQNGEEVMIHITPILPNGDVLSEDELNDYIDNVLNGAQNILEADSKKNGGLGLVLNVDSDTSIEQAGKWGDELHLIQEKYYDIKQQILDIDNLSKGSPLGDIIGKISKDGKDKIKKAIEADLANIDYTEAKKNFDKFLNDLTKELDTYKDKFNIYEQILNLGGSEDLAINLSGVDSGNLVDSIKTTILKAVQEVRPTVTIETVLDQKDLPDQVQKLVDAANKAVEDAQKNSLLSAAKLLTMESPEGMGMSFDLGNVVKQYSVELLNLQNELRSALNAEGLTDEQKNEIQANTKLAMDANTKIYADKAKKSGAVYAQEQIEIAGLGEAFKNMSTASYESLLKMLDITEEAKKDLISGVDAVSGFKNVGFSEDESKRLATEEPLFTNLFKSEDLEQFQEILEQIDKVLNTNDTISITSKLGINPEDINKLKLWTAQQKGAAVAVGNTQREINKFRVNKIIKLLGNLSQSLDGAIDGIKGLSSAFGKELDEMTEGSLNLLSTIVSSTTNVISIMTSTTQASANAMKATSIAASTSIQTVEKASVILAVIGAALQIATAIAGMFSNDKKLDKEIAASQLRVEKLQNLYSEVERLISRNLGGAQNLDLGLGDTDKRLEEINNQISQLQAKSKDNVILRIKYSSNIKELEAEQKKLEAYNEGGAYALQRQNLIQQQEELQKQRQAEIDKKKTDESKVVDYENQIKELDDTIRHFAEDTLKELYDIDLKDWASQIGDSLFDAWKKGEDGAVAFKNKVGELMGQVMNEILKIKVLEPAMKGLQDKLFGTDGKSGYFGKDFELSDDEVVDIAKSLMSVQDSTDKYNKAMDKVEEELNKFGVSMKESTDEDEGLSKGIKEITEDTAQLLASYLNAIRGSVLLQELYMQNIDTNVAGIYHAMGGGPNITTTAAIPPEVIATIIVPFKLNNSLLASIDMNISNNNSIAANSLAQLVMIQANTYNAAMATREAVEELRGVISPGHPKGGNGIKVWA